MTNLRHFFRGTTTLLTIVSMSGWFSLPPVQAQETSEVDLYSLCSRFPLNSRCEGYEAPVSLKQRSGSSAACILDLGEIDYSGDCKVSFSEEVLTVYLEQGDKLAILDNERTTTTFDFNLSDVTALGYSDYEETNVAELVGLTFLFGLPGLLIHRNDEYSRLDISLNSPQGESTVTIVSSQNVGIPLRSRLERLTGIFAVTPETETETEPVTEVQTESPASNPPPIENLEAFCSSYPYNSQCQN